MKHLNILKILLERKKFLFLVLFIIIGLQLCWSFFRSRSLGVRPTPETWTFYHLDQRALDRNSNTFLWKLSDKDDDNDWKKVFDPETFDYDVHLEISGDRKSPDTRMTSKSNLNLSTEVIPNGLNSTATSPKLAVPFTPLVPIGDMDGLLLDEATNFATPGLLNIAIGSGLTTAKLLDLTESNLHEKMQLFKSFLPSFCQTASIEVDGRSRFNYHFYFAYDYTDKVLDGLVRGGGFYRVFKWVMDKFCPKGLLSFLHFVQCDHTHRPAWAQNDAMIEAYLDNVDYFYRINDDTLMKSKNWTEIFVEVLNRYDPPNVGVVGPSHSGGNTAILTYDFVHKTHLDVFGFYYPRLFTDWWGDDWVTKVYLPHRMTKVRSIFLQHTLALGQRYSVKDWGVSKKLGDQLIRDRITLERYIRLRRKIKDGDLKPVPSRVISMSLYSSKPRHIWGAIRNAQLARILFPTWKLRFYVSRQSLNSNPPSDNNVDLHDHMTNDTKVSRRILKRLRLLGAEIKLVNDQAVKKVQPMNWRNLAIMDDDVEWVLMRNVDSRLTESEANGVERWIDNFKRRLNIDSQLLSLDTIAHFLSSFVGIYNPDQKKPAALHVIRDLPNSVSDAFPAGLWGGNAHLLRLLLEDTLQSIHQVSSEIPSGNVTSNSGNSVEIQSKIKSLNIDNPYLNPGLEELVRTWSTKPNESKMNSSYLGRLAKRLMVERLDYITCNGELDPKLQSHFAGQRFDEHEWPYLDNDVNVKTAYPNLGAVSPSLLCKTIDNVIVHYTTQAANTTVRTPSKGMPTRTNYGTNTTLSLKKIAS